MDNVFDVKNYFQGFQARCLVKIAHDKRWGLVPKISQLVTFNIILKKFYFCSTTELCFKNSVVFLISVATEKISMFITFSMCFEKRLTWKEKRRKQTEKIIFSKISKKKTIQYRRFILDSLESASKGELSKWVTYFVSTIFCSLYMQFLVWFL